MKVLTDMEFEGVRIDESFLKEYSKNLNAEAKQVRECLHKTVGVNLILSHRQNNWVKYCRGAKIDPKAKKDKNRPICNW